MINRKVSTNTMRYKWSGQNTLKTYDQLNNI